MEEATRNRLLRRVDWRFLLPEPGAARTVCFTSGELRQAVALIAGYLPARRAGGGGRARQGRARQERQGARVEEIGGRAQLRPSLAQRN